LLTAISVRNVRLFRGDWRFELRPLTLFCGSNSVGKSTLLKIPVLLREIQGPLSADLSGASRLRLQGPRLDLGNFKTFVSDQDESLDVGIGLEIADRMATRRLDVLRSLSARTATPTGQGSRFEPYRLAARFDYRAPDRLSRLTGGRHDGYLAHADFALSDSERQLLYWEVDRETGTRDTLDTFGEYAFMMPEAYFRRISPRASASTPEPDAIEGGRVRFGSHLFGLLPGILVARRTKRTAVRNSERPYHLPLPPHIAEATADFRVALEAVRYLAPLRAPARRYYVAGGASIPDWDTTGEFLPYVLRDNRGRRVTFFPPGNLVEKRRTTLQAACDLWLHYLRTGDFDASEHESEVAVSSFKEALVEVRMRSTGGRQLHALVDSGFGYSQVLPILVSCLIAPVGSVILVEQPEVHLNPALQVRLAEFFVAVVRSGRQVIVETHSEHIVNAIRVLVAEDQSHELLDSVLVTYLEDRGGEIERLDLSVNADGTVREWPRQFFGEALELSARLMSAQRQRLQTPS
jgi:hypothetical protein